jgi:hypothetical protein
MDTVTEFVETSLSYVLFFFDETEKECVEATEFMALDIPSQDVSETDARPKRREGGSEKKIRELLNNGVVIRQYLCCNQQNPLKLGSLYCTNCFRN